MDHEQPLELTSTSKKERTTQRNASNGSNGNKIVIFAKHEQSLLSELYCKDINVRIFCQMTVFVSVLSLVSVIISDSIKAQRFHWKAYDSIDSFTLKDIFSSLLVAISLHLAAIIFYPVFKLWIKLRSFALPVVVDVVFLILYLVTIVLSFVYILWFCPYFEVPQYIKVVVSLEQCRLCMKSYSFVRENAIKVLYPWHKNDTNGQITPMVGSFKQYCYFLIAPTFLYRDNYPRSQTSPKSLVTFLVLFISSVLVMIHLYGMIQIDNFHWQNVLLSFITGLPFGIVYSVSLNVCVLHSWMNFAAEVTGFGDRRFYEDWWYSNSWDIFYRKWNIIPYHFNHQYIYRDIRKITNNKYLALFLMLLVSSLVHEYCTAIGVGHAVPMITILFAGFGTVVYALKYNGPFFMISALSVGFYLLVWNLSLESNARRLCPREETFIDLFYPRLFECIAKYSI